MTAEQGGEIIFEDEWIGEGFGMIPATILFNENLPPAAKALYAALWYWGVLNRRHNEPVPPQDEMGERLGCDRRTIQRNLRELETLGYVDVQRRGSVPNRYVILSLSHNATKTSHQADATKMSHEMRHQRRDRSDTSVTTHNNDNRTPNTLSNNAALAAAFFAAIGEDKPSKTRRERASKIIDDLTAEGFTDVAIRAAIDLAAERGARGPDLLPHVIGEAHTRVTTRAKTTQKEAVQAALFDQDRQEREATFKRELAAVDALPAGERQRLEAEARKRLPATVSDDFAARLLPGMIAARLREREQA